MKIWFLPLLAAAALSACAGSDNPKKSAMHDEQAVGMANPASVFCEQQGGKSVNRKDKDGNEYGVCVFPDGKEVDEWEYYRANHK